MLCLRLERTVGLEELESMFGPITPVKTTETPVVSSNHPTPIAPTDPAAASRPLLERIRAMRIGAREDDVAGELGKSKGAAGWAPFGFPPWFSQLYFQHLEPTSRN